MPRLNTISKCHRRHIIILFIILLCALILFACQKTTPTITPTPTATYTQPPSDNNQPSTSTHTPTPTLTPTPLCLQLIEPLEGAQLPAIGKVTFSWQSAIAVDSYILEFSTPSGDTITFTTTETVLIRYIESLPARLENPPESIIRIQQ